MVTLCQEHPRIDLFEKIAPYYDLLLDIFTFGQYVFLLQNGLKMLSPQNGERILDLCSGTGRVASWIARNVGETGEVVGMDITPKMIEVAKERYGKSKNLVFLQKDVTQPWGYENYFDGILTSFALHELPEKKRQGVLEKSYLALREKGRMVIVDFNPQVSGKGRVLAGLFFKLFERRNLNFFSLRQNEILRKEGFRRVRTSPILAGIFQVTLALKNG